MSGHTKGPWKADEKDDGTWWVVGDGMQVAHCHAMTDEQNLRNARLIAAAPDMLNTLEHIVYHLPLGMERNLVMQIIKKARGG